MTRCDDKFGVKVEIRPILYLRNYKSADPEFIEKLGDFGLPIYTDDEIFSIPEVLRLCGEKGWTHIICLSDLKQNFLESLEELKVAILNDPWAFHFIVKKESQKKLNHPLMQRLLDVGDKDFRQYQTQNLILPVFFVQDFIDLKNDKFIFDKILLSAIKNRHCLKKIVLDYQDLKASPSFFHKFIQAHYDALLLALTSFENGTRPLHSAISLAVGVFLACSPFYGLQTGLIIAATFIFRLSFPVAFLGSQISIPPIYSLVVPLELYVGFSFTGMPFEFTGPLLEVAQTHFVSWLIGACIVGTGLALVLGFCWYRFQKSYHRKEVAWTGQMRGGRIGNALMKKLIGIGGLPLAYFLLYFIVPYFYLFAPKARKGLTQYYKILRPQTTWAKRQWFIIKHLYRFAQTIVDQAYQAARQDLVFEISYDDSNEARKPGQNNGAGLLLLSHFGGWGVATQGFSRRYPGRIINMFKYESEKLTEEKVFKEKTKGHLKKISVQPGEPVFMTLHEILDRKELLAVMGDRPFDNNIELIPFLGRLAPIPSSPFRMAKNYSAELSFIVGYKKMGREYGLAIKIMDVSQMSLEESMKAYVGFLEKYVKRYPEQWFNHYPLWTTLPTRPDGSSCRPRRYRWADSGKKKSDLKTEFIPLSH